jgi:hypothetical protein
MRKDVKLVDGDVAIAGIVPVDADIDRLSIVHGLAPLSQQVAHIGHIRLSDLHYRSKRLRKCIYARVLF